MIRSFAKLSWPARHLGSAMRKLNVSSRTALAARALQAGLIPGGG